MVYRIIEMQDTIRIPPELLGDDLEHVMEELVHKSFEGKLSRLNGITVLTQNVRPVGEGLMIHGDGDIYQRVKFEALVFRPEIQEVVDGIVAEVAEFGAFVHIGPLDALVHMSQVMNDYVSVDTNNERLVGKESKKEVGVGDSIRARIVTASLNELSPRESKIGLTMRQPGLGKHDWLVPKEEKRGGQPAAKKMAKTTVTAEAAPAEAKAEG